MNFDETPCDILALDGVRVKHFYGRLLCFDFDFEALS